MQKFCCILILHFDGQTEFSRVFNFAILSYLQNLQKFHACENNMVYSINCGNGNMTAMCSLQNEQD